MLSFSKFLFSTAAKQAKVGFIGCGNMGHYMVKNLLKNGFNVAAYDVQKQALQATADIGATPCSSIAQVSKDRDYILTMLPHPDVSMKVYTEGQDCIIKNAKKGTILVESSTVKPQTVTAIQKLASEKGLVTIDAPVSGAQMGAINGTLIFMVGAENEANFQKAQPFLRGMGNVITHCGKVGAGQVIKICNNLVLSVNVTVLAEGYNFALRHGVDPMFVKKVFETTAANSFANTNYNPYPGIIPQAPSSNNYEGGFYTTHMIKDMNLAIQAADSVGANLDTVKFTIERFKKMVKKQGIDRKDWTIIYQEIAGNLK